MTKRLFTYAFVALWALFAIVSSATAEEVKIGVVNAAYAADFDGWCVPYTPGWESNSY